MKLQEWRTQQQAETYLLLSQRKCVIFLLETNMAVP